MERLRSCKRKEDENEEDGGEENTKDEYKTRHRKELWWRLEKSAFAVSCMLTLGCEFVGG